MQTIKQNLQYIAKSIENGTHKEQSAILHLMIVETIQDMKELDTTFQVPYSTESYKHHFQAYINTASKYKATLLTNMEEVERELFTRKGNPQRALKLIQQMLQTNLYKDNVIHKIYKWVNTTHTPTKTEIIYSN